MKYDIKFIPPFIRIFSYITSYNIKTYHCGIYEVRHAILKEVLCKTISNFITEN